MSGLATSEEKNTEATTDFNSTSMPAFWQACLTMAWVFCRGPLIEVWYSSFSLLPSFSRMPSAPGFQPAASSSLAAFSMLNSHDVFLETNFSGPLR